MSKQSNRDAVAEFLGACDLYDDLIESPVMSKKTNKKGEGCKINYWSVFIGLLQKGSVDTKRHPLTKEDVLSNRVTWDESTHVPAVWYEYGELPSNSNPYPARQISKPTLIDKGKNLGKANYTSPLMQAALSALSKYKAKAKKGYSTSLNDTLAPMSEKLSRDGGKVFPMALQNVRDKGGWNRVRYPAYVQPKLNGSRLIIVNYNGSHIAYAKGRDTVNVPHLLAAMKSVLDANPGVYFDGEYYKHGVALQDINGSLKTHNGGAAYDYYVFDTFTVHENPEDDEPFSERYLLTKKLVEEVNSQYVVLVETIEVHERDEIETLYKKYLDECGYEGAVIRMADSTYEYSLDGVKRSYGSLKYKPRHDDEFPIVGYTHGTRGKEIDLIIFICTITDETINKLAQKFGKRMDIAKDLSDVKVDNRRFTVTPNFTAEERRNLLRAADEGIIHFTGQLATIQYSEPSADSKPQQPKMLKFFDEDFDIEAMDIARGGRRMNR